MKNQTFRPLKRVVITGLGVVSSIGLGRAAYAAALRKGQSGCGLISRFPCDTYPFRLAHEVRNFDLNQKSRDRVLEYAIAAADEAVIDSAADLTAIDPYRLGVSVSSSKGGIETLAELLNVQTKSYYPARAKNLFEDIFPSAPALRIAAKHRCSGPVKSWIAACATGNLAASDAYYLLSEGYADAIIAGASDASIVPMFLAGYHQMKVLAKDRMRPFDKERGGFLVGEGAAMFFMETLEAAQARKAKIYAEVAAVGLGQENSHALFFSDDEGTLSETMKLALARADETPRSLDYINLHGTATGHGDLYETREIKKAFGAHAYDIATSGIKPMTGHMLGASGAAEIAATLLAMDGGFVPPTLGLAQPDPECDLNYTAGVAAEKEIRVAMSISMGFGGQAAAIILRKP